MSERSRAWLRAAAELRRMESLRLVLYRDIGGVPTIGYGHRCRPDCAPIVEQDAEALLMADIGAADSALSGLVLSECQRAALICFVFNVGLLAFRDSTMRRLLVAGEYDQAARQFKRWVHVGQGERRRVCDGLANRRAVEYSIFCGGV